MRAEMLIAVIIAVLFLAILIFILVQLTRFLAKFEQERRDFDEDLIGLAGQIKKMQTTLAEILIEQRRITRLTVEGLDLKKAENERIRISYIAPSKRKNFDKTRFQEEHKMFMVINRISGSN